MSKLRQLVSTCFCHRYAIGKANSGDSNRAVSGGMIWPRNVTNRMIEVVCVRYRLKDSLPKSSNGFDLKKAVNRGESMHNSRNKMMPSPVRSNAFRTWNDNPSAERIHWLGIKNGIAQAERIRKPRCSRTKARMAGRCFANTAPITKKIA